MNIKYYLYSGAIILTLLVLVFVNERKGNYYRMSVEEAHTILKTVDINISSEELNAADPGVLQLNIVLDNKDIEVFRETENQILVPLENLVTRKFLKRLIIHKGIIAITTEDHALAAHSWLILTRKGIENIKIVGISSNEVLNHSFEPQDLP